MNNLENFLFDFFTDSKNSGIDVCILRNFDALPYRVLGSDIDISVRSPDKMRVVSSLLRHAEKHGYSLHSRFNKSYGILHLRFVNIEDFSFLKFDIMSDIGVSNRILWSQNYISQNSVLQPNGLFSGPALSLQLAVVISYSLITKNYIKERYLQIIREQPSLMQEIRHHLHAVDIHLVDLDIQSGAVRLESQRNSIFSKERLFPSLRRSIDNVLRYIAPPGLMISFTGPDGSGKSTVIDSLIKNETKFYTGQYALHLRPHFLPSLSSTFDNRRKRRSTSLEGSDFQKQKALKLINKVTQICRLVYYWSDYVIGYWLKIRPLLARDYLVVFDRYFYDYHFDFNQKAVDEMDFFVKFLGFLVPNPTYNFILVADANTISSRKNELSMSEIETQYKKINSTLTDNKNSRFVKSDGSLNGILDHVKTTIMLKQDNLIQ